MTFIDAEAAVKTALEAGYGTDPPITIDFPTAPIAKGSFRIQLDFEGDDADDYPVTARSTVRVVVWGNRLDRGLVKDEAERVRSILSGSRLTGVAGFVPGGRSAVAQDADTTNLSCFVRVRVDLLAAPAAS